MLTFILTMIGAMILFPAIGFAATTAKMTAQGTTGGKGKPDYKEFAVEFDGYSEESGDLKDSIKNITGDYGELALVQLINKSRGVTAVNSERTRLTAGKAQEKTTKANAFDEIASASTQEEKLAIMKKYDLA